MQRYARLLYILRDCETVVLTSPCAQPSISVASALALVVSWMTQTLLDARYSSQSLCWWKQCRCISPTCCKITFTPTAVSLLCMGKLSTIVGLPERTSILRRVEQRPR